MKKLILTILCISAFTVMNANSTNGTINTNTLESTAYYEVNSFCKLIQMGKYEAVKALIDAGQDVNEFSNGLTPLMFAARHNRADIVKLLIKNGAKLKTKSRKKMTALDWAKKSKAMEAHKVLEFAIEKSKKKRK